MLQATVFATSSGSELRTTAHVEIAEYADVLTNQSTDIRERRVN